MNILFVSFELAMPDKKIQELGPFSVDEEVKGF